MGLINYSNISDGTTVDASDVNNPFNTIYNEFNGNIDGNNLVDNAITTAKITDSSVTTAKIADASITNAKLSTTAGDVGGVWKSYTPTFANTTKGSGTVEGYYTQIGKTVHFRASFTLAADSAVGTTPTVSLPVTAVANTSLMGQSISLDSGSNNYLGSLLYASTTTATPVVAATNGNYSSVVTFTATVPFTWTTNDRISVSGTYEAA